MKPACLRHTAIPGAAKLFTDFLYRHDQVARFFGEQQGESEPFAGAAKALDYPDERRARLVEALRPQNGGSPQLEALARPGAIVVATGQQVGLFSGPCYTIYKALTAARLARDLTERGQPAVAVFWLATEDHDAEEVNHCRVFDGKLMPRTLRVDTSGYSQWPAGTIPLRQAPIEELRSALGDAPHAGEVMELVEAHYTNGRTLGEAFGGLLRQLLSSLGLLFLDPLQPAIREISAPLMERALAQMPELVHAVLDRSQELVAAGYHAQVHVEPQSSLFFLLEGERRVPLTNRRPPSPDALSANALLRPVQQDYLLPTVAVVAGPAEVAYLAQSEVLYQRLLGRMPVVVPRGGFTVLDARAAKLMERYDLSIPSLFHGREALHEAVAARLVPSELDAGFAGTRDTVSASLDQLRTGLDRFDPTLAAALDSSRTKILYQVDKLQRKAGREAIRRERRATSDSDFLWHLLYPEKHLQERYYTILPFVARHGLDLVDRLYENIHLDCPDHVVLTV